MELYGKIQCVTLHELVGAGILSVPSYKKKVRNKEINVVRPGKGPGTYSLIDYKRLPEKIKTAYDAKYPDAMKQISLDSKPILRTDDDAINFYFNHKPSIDADRQDELVLNAQVLNEMSRVETDTRTMHSACGHNRRGLVWQAVFNTCEQLRVDYQHTLPTAETRLRQKFNDYKRLGYTALINRNTGNQHTRKMGTEEARLALKLRRSLVPRYTEAQLFDQYNVQAVERGLSIIKSPNTLRSYLYSPAVLPLWYGVQRGMKAWKQKYSSQQKTELPTMANSLWYGDGTKLNLYYKNDAGKMCTINVYEVMDAATEVFLGYDVAPTENFDSQYRAFRMAVETAGVRPYEIVTDNQGSQRKDIAVEFFAKVAVLARPTAPYNGQSKTIESAFGRFQQQVLYKIWNFTGQNIIAKKEGSRPNMELIEQNAYALPTLAEVKAIYQQCREEWNNMPHFATGIPRKEMYNMSDNPDALPVTGGDNKRMFWIMSEKSVEYTNYGIRFTRDKKEYHYDVYAVDGLRNEAWAMSNTNQSFFVKYDPLNMTTIELWADTNSGKKFSAIATPKVTIARGTQERTEDQTSHMRRTLQLNKEVMALAQLEGEKFDQEEKISLELFGLSTPPIKGIKKDRMTQLREAYDSGSLQSPLVYPGHMQEDDNEEEDLAEVAYASFGEYTKKVSNIGWEEVHAEDRF